MLHGALVLYQSQPLLLIPSGVLSWRLPWVLAFVCWLFFSTALACSSGFLRGRHYVGWDCFLLACISGNSTLLISWMRVLLRVYILVGRWFCASSSLHIGQLCCLERLFSID